MVVQNGDLTSGLPLRFEPLTHPRLVELAERENLQGVVEGARDELDTILRLREWTARQFPRGAPDPYPPWDAISVLDSVRGGVTGGFCAQYAQVYLQALASLGLQGRYVEIGLKNNPFAHFVTEVWSNQFNKWVVMDVDFNMHFEKNGLPLSALEVHQALVRSELSDLIFVTGELHEGDDYGKVWRPRLAEFYYYVRVHLKANHLSAPNEPAFDRFNDTVEYANHKTVPWELSDVDSVYAKEPLTRTRSGDPTEFGAKLNQTQMSIQVEPAVVTLALDTNVVEFSHYEYRELAGPAAAANWVSAKNDRITWKPNPARPRLEARGVNARGVPGPTAAVEAHFE